MEKGKLAICVHFSEFTFDHKGQETGKLCRWKNSGIIGCLGHPLFFLRLPSNAFPDIGSVGRIEKKKKKKNHKKSRNSRPWYPRTTLKVSNILIFRLTKCTIYCEKCSCFCSCFSLCCYYAHFSDPKIWVGRTTVSREKRGDGLTPRRF